MKVIAHKKIYLSIAAVMVAASAMLIMLFPPQLGIDFTGGALIEVAAKEGVTQADLEAVLGELDLTGATVRATNEDRFLIKTAPLTEEEHQRVREALFEAGVREELRFTSIGPTIGAELKQSGAYAIALVVLLIVLYIAFVFRKVSKPVASWKYGIVAIAALLHDLIIPIGIFALLSIFAPVSIDALFITALLAILGISINDTIVVFDRIRENLEKKPGGDFAITVERSIGETFTRSINTSVTTLLVLAALLVVGPDSTRYFVLALMLGMIAGTYSSIFVASPLLVWWHERSKR